MQIQLDSRNPNSIISYDDHQIKINDEIYQNNVIVSADTIMTPWDVSSVKDLDTEHLLPIVKMKPEVIIIGHSEMAQPPFFLYEWLSKKRIGLECMQIGPACRTFNVLLSEDRSCVLGLIFKHK